MYVICDNLSLFAKPLYKKNTIYSIRKRKNLTDF